MAPVDAAAAQLRLCDLHTHLLGCGDAAFWMHDVMARKIPMLVQRKQVERYVGIPSHATLDVESPLPLAPCEGATEFDENDVVYDEKTLYLVFIANSAAQVAETASHDHAFFASQLLAYFGRSFVDKMYSYRIFNARKQAPEERFGLKNAHLVEMFARGVKHMRDDDVTLEALFKRAFEMDVHGVDADKLMRERFTPEFYPARYALKDDMYSQYPELLDYLLDYALTRYAKAGVGYVEFSVGLGDVERAHIWRHLVAPAGLSSEAQKVTVRYLAGFNRCACNVALSMQLDTVNDKARSGLAGFIALSEKLARQKLIGGEASSSRLALAHAMCTIRDDDLIALYDVEELRKLRTVSAAIETSRSATTARGLHERLVGFDLFGDEREHPFSPFHVDEFVRVVERENAHRKFGVRMHFGEVSFVDAREGGLLHAGVLAHVASGCHSILSVSDMLMKQNCSFASFLSSHSRFSFAKRQRTNATFASDTAYCLRRC